MVVLVLSPGVLVDGGGEGCTFVNRGLHGVTELDRERDGVGVIWGRRLELGVLALNIPIELTSAKK